MAHLLPRYRGPFFDFDGMVETCHDGIIQGSAPVTRWCRKKQPQEPRITYPLEMRLSRRSALVTLSLLTVFTLLCLLQDPRPEALDDTGPDSAFSSVRAMHHLSAIAHAPHPVGSPAHQEVRDFLLARLDTLGIEADIQEGLFFTGRRRHGSLGAGARINNVVARIRGTGSGPAILLDAHYDSVDTAPGANDDGVGVAVLLESLRALAAGPPMHNDIIVLFSDAEEVGLVGASAFANHHPWAKDVALVVNLEARGDGGTPIMFQTGSGNLNQMREFRRAVPSSIASSLTYEIYKLLPNDTNFSVFRSMGWPGFDFAYIDGVTAYHTSLDSVANVDPKTVQHFGESVLSFCRHFGDVDLASLSSDADAVYFDLLGRFMVVYPASWALPLAIVVCLVFATVFVIGLGRRAFSWRALVGGFLLVPIAVTASAGAVFGLRWVILLLHPSYSEMLQGELYNGSLYALGFTMLALAITSGLLAIATRGEKPMALVCAVLGWWVLLAPVAALHLRGVSYLTTWPTLSGLVALCVLLWRWPRIRENGVSRSMALIVAMCALPTIILFAPLIELLFIGLTTSMSWAIAALVSLGLLLLAPQLEVVQREKRWLVPLLSGTGCLLCLVLGSATAGFDEDHPRPNSIRYELDADSGAAQWTSFDHRIDAWTRQFLGDAKRRDEAPYFVAPAPLLDMQPPGLEVLEYGVGGDPRRLKLLLTSHRAAPVLHVYPADRAKEITILEIVGSPVEQAPGEEPRFSFYDVPTDGIEVVVDATVGARIVLEDRSYGLPEISGFTPRTAAMMAKPFRRSDLAIVRRVIEIPAAAPTEPR